MFKFGTTIVYTYNTLYHLTIDRNVQPCSQKSGQGTQEKAYHRMRL